MASAGCVLVEPESTSELVRPDGYLSSRRPRGWLGPARGRWAEATSASGQLRLACWSHACGPRRVASKLSGFTKMAGRLRRSVGRRETGDLPSAAPRGGRLSGRGDFSLGNERGKDHGSL